MDCSFIAEQNETLLLKYYTISDYKKQFTLLLSISNTTELTSSFKLKEIIIKKRSNSSGENATSKPVACPHLLLRKH